GCDRVVVVGPVPGGLPGGPRRRDSVAAGLAALGSQVEWVLVHDAARPLASSELVSRVLARLVRGDCDGVVPVVPVRDTIKEVEAGMVVRTVDRQRLVVVQTPQGFPLGMLRKAHAATDDDVSDDAVLVERAGGSVVVVEGEALNLKVTHPEDLALAEGLV
ncbi:MAG TPA: 2-C-methyl-D-erythritol 4-phosphate cytidylyltransferase, partial [Acidimicrobiia bacterium]